MKGAARGLRRAAARAARLVREMNDAKRRMTVLTMAPDRYVIGAERAPQDYSEFLGRTSGPMLCEPSAKARRAGRRVG
ncbi:MAG TPA: hypothetical protein VF834_03640 [Streptosporangiaceae bacterium]